MSLRSQEPWLPCRATPEMQGMKSEAALFWEWKMKRKEM